MRFVLTLLFLLSVSFSAFAVEPDEMLKDAKLEARAVDLSKNLRCMVCQGESIEESNAELARDLRALVRERIKAGDSDEQILAYLHDRYGDFVLFKPPFNAKNSLLWIAPFAVLLIGFAVAFKKIKKSSS